MKPEFSKMTMGELKRYVLEHRRAQAAFQVLMERGDAQPQEQLYGDVDLAKFSELLEQYQHSQQTKVEEV
jgi:hypothetical protein